MNRGDLADLTAFVAVADQLSFRTPDCWVITTKTLKISSCKNPAARSRTSHPHATRQNQSPAASHMVRSSLPAAENLHTTGH